MSNRVTSIRQKIYAVIDVIKEVRPTIDDEELLALLTMVFPFVANDRLEIYLVDWKQHQITPDRRVSR